MNISIVPNCYTCICRYDEAAVFMQRVLPGSSGKNHVICVFMGRMKTFVNLTLPLSRATKEETSYGPLHIQATVDRGSHALGNCFIHVRVLGQSHEFLLLGRCDRCTGGTPLSFRVHLYPAYSEVGSSDTNVHFLSCTGL